MGRPPYRLLREDDRTRIKYIQQRYEKLSGPRELTGGERKYLLGKRREILNLIADLIWFAQELPEDQLCQVFTQERIDELMSALLTVHTVDLRPGIEDPKRLIKESRKDLERLIERQDQIAAMIMNKGAAKCLEAFERKEKESPLYRWVEREAGIVIDVLNYVATGAGGVDRDYTHHPDRYKPQLAPAKRERPRSRRDSP